MPTGRRAGRPPLHLRRRPCSRAQPPARGAGYLLLLFLVALLGAALGAVAPSWQQAMQREREAELAFRGLQILQGLARYAAESPDGWPPRPQSLEELLVDRRRPQARHHLRRLYPDPFTGRADWVLLRAPDGTIQGLRSRSDRPLLRAQPPAGVRLAMADSDAQADANRGTGAGGAGQAHADTETNTGAGTRHGTVPVRASQWLFELAPPRAAEPLRSAR